MGRAGLLGAAPITTTAGEAAAEGEMTGYKVIIGRVIEFTRAAEAVSRSRGDGST